MELTLEVGVWPFLLEVGGWSFFLWVGVGPVLLQVVIGPVLLVWGLALPSRDGELALLSRGCFFSSVVVGPSFLPFLLAVSGPHSFVKWGLALLGMGIGP